MPPKPPLNWGLLPPSFLLPSSTTPNSSFLTTTARRTIKSINTPRPDRFAHNPKLPALGATTTAALERKAATLPLRSGALAIKRGMTALYDPETGKRAPCTVLQLERNEVVAHKTRQQHGYWAVQVGAGWKHPSNVTRPLLGHYAKAGVSPKRWMAEFRVKDEAGLAVKVGESIGAGWFKEGQFVDARSKSRGMGFEGGMKKHGWGGQPASHGNSLAHRAMGSSGGGQGSGSRVHPGKNMPGRMGGERVTIQNLKVLKVDEPNGLVVVNGCVGGPKGCIVQIQDAIKKPWPDITMPLSDSTTAAAAEAVAV